MENNGTKRDLENRYELVDEKGEIFARYQTARGAAADLRDGWSIQTAGASTIWQRADCGPVKVA